MKSTKEQKPGLDILEEASGLVYGDRQASYGSPRQMAERVAGMWNAFLDAKLKEKITPEEISLMLLLLKVQRQSSKPKRDNIVDIVGYVLVHERVVADQ